MVNSEVEEAYTGHSLVTVFGRRERDRRPLRGAQREAVQGHLRRAVRLLDDHADDDVRGEPQLRGRSRSWAGCGSSPASSPSATCRPSSSTPASSPSRCARSPRWRPCSSPAWPAPSGSSNCWTPRSRRPRRRLDTAAAGIREGRVEFEHVAFSYTPERELIRDLSLVADPGHTVAIVGPTGAGKTTLVNLVMRFYEVGRRPDHDRRDRHPRSHPRPAARAHRHGPPGHLAVQGLAAGEHPLRPPRRDRRGGHRGRPRHPRGRLRAPAAGRLRHGRGR